MSRSSSCHFCVPSSLFSYSSLCQACCLYLPLPSFFLFLIRACICPYPSVGFSSPSSPLEPFDPEASEPKSVYSGLFFEFHGFVSGTAPLSTDDRSPEGRQPFLLTGDGFGDYMPNLTPAQLGGFDGFLALQFPFVYPDRPRKPLQIARVPDPMSSGFSWLMGFNWFACSLVS